MRIAVMGSGGLGGYFGARLARGGAEVSFIARGAHLDAMRADGLRVEGGSDPFHLERVRATDRPEDVGPVDLVMVCVKLWDTDAALRAIRPLVGPGTALVSFQNGVLKDALLRDAFDDASIMGGVAYVAATVSRPGVIKRTGSLSAWSSASSTAPGRRVAKRSSRPAWPGASTRSSATTSGARSGRSSSSWWACRR